MKRKMYEPTKNQQRKWDEYATPQMPADDEFRTRGKKEHTPWGILKRDFVLSTMIRTAEYQMGLWQGRVDKAQEFPYSEERNENTYNLGYHRGYTGYESNRKGWDVATRQRFDKKYLGD